MNLTQENFDQTVLEFAKAIAPAGNYATDNCSFVFEQARAYAITWYKNKDAQQAAFQNLIDDLDDESQNPTEPQSEHFATFSKKNY